MNTNEVKNYFKKSKYQERGITLVALVVTIIVLLILAGVTISMATSGSGIFGRAKNAADVYRASAKKENDALDSYSSEIDKADEGTEGGSGSITYTDSAGKAQTLTKGTPAGTKIGTTANIDGQTLDWYLFDVSDDGKTAYLVSTPTYWVPDTTKEVSGAWVPKLVSSADSKTGAMNQAIQKKDSATSGSYSYSYSSGSVTYNPSDSTWNYFKSVNPKWSAKRGDIDLKNEFKTTLKENEQSACYLADADIFAGIKEQVNNADGNLKGKIQTLVGGASAEQWCKAYNKQTKVKEQQPNGGITCEYSTKNVPGYIYKVNGTVQNSGWYTNTNTIFGNDIYGAANNNGNTTNNPFYNNSWWWLASPSAHRSRDVCSVSGNYSNLYYDYSNYCDYRFSLFASVSL